FDGFTNGEGFLEISIPPNAQEGRLIMNPNQPDQRIYPLQLGTLGSADEIAGMKRRLSNLGFNCGDQENEMTEDFEKVLILFQETHELDITGELDDATKNKILELTD
ncbi:MAG: peptidoglycan-binding domain-containing protein, partial [Desulfobacterales bacterium]|nr:peptidoglycan-binding domain-containing protein [Desulfobacterales bacterium]MDX2513540.1 peptidoglycan-binding domain-containing protein [Desulfobacterales bacterium]